MNEIVKFVLKIDQKETKQVSDITCHSSWN